MATYLGASGSWRLEPGGSSGEARRRQTRPWWISTSTMSHDLKSPDLSSTFVSQNRSGLDTNLASSEDSSAGELDLNAEPDILELTMEAQEDEDNLQHDHDNGEFDLNVEPEEEGDDILDLTIELQEDEENLQHEQDTAGFDLNLEPVQDVDDIPDLTAGIQEEKCKNCLRACSDCPRGIP